MADTQTGGAKKIPFEFTQGTFWGGPWYPYWSLTIFTVLGGFFGLDHVWLRSPMTGFIKFLVNCVTFGFWWFYDMVQVFSEKDNVMKYGLSAPLYGPMGLGAGIFRDNQPGAKLSKSPFRYLLYLPLVFLPLGLDFLVAGDSNGALFRLLSLFIFILWPLAFIWTFINVYYAYANPKSLFEKGTTRFFPWSWIGDPNGPSKLGPKDVNYPPDGCDPGGIRGVFRRIISIAGTAIGAAVGAALNVFLPGVAPAARSISTTVKTGADAAHNVIVTAKPVVETAIETAGVVIDTTGKIVKEAGPPLAAAAVSAASLAKSLPALAASSAPLTAGVGANLQSFTSSNALKGLAQEAVTGVASSAVASGLTSAGLDPSMAKGLANVKQLGNANKLQSLAEQAIMGAASGATDPSAASALFGAQSGGGIRGGLEAMMSGGGTAESASFTDAALIILLTSLFAGGVVMAFKRLKTTYTPTKRDDGRTRDDSPPKPHGV